MRAKDRAVARQQLDKRLNSLRYSDAFARPPRGWIKAIREALGMTTAQLGKRLGVSQPRVVKIEHAETKGSITLDSLERAANALDCRLVYALVPRKPLDEQVTERAERLAKKRLKSTSHSMALEDQEVDTADEQEQLKRMIQSLLDKAGSELWDEDL
ncbi:putative DNA-binding mobile mystery protein A [Thiogranum longum]|uniref:Putative DNA-binding mobile mystery protein A n=1 Tax=Thiogranum longum TaxID=1537524 RepID=A0A4R1HD00_9GAMM|nr:mobile mystery protein A [Thiogranum longum]TCK19348.1 putative DNA-binding mobile mystery protein A [Thiogranum longum]